MNFNLLNDVAQLLMLNELHSISDHFIVLRLETNGVILNALVDSAASYNYISKQAVDHLKMGDDDLKFNKNSHKVQVADRTVLNSLGSVTLDAVLDNHTFTSKFTVMETLSFDIILGMSFLKARCRGRRDFF